MIGTINIKVSASRPNMPLGPFHVFAGSAASFTIVDIPLPLGVRKVTGVTLSAKNVAGVATGFAAVRVGSAWGVTVPPTHFAASGSVERGVSILATGVDDAGEAVTPWKLGAGDVYVMEPDGSVAPGETVHDMHWHDVRPEHPVGGDVAPYEGGVYYFNGGAWVRLSADGDVSHSEFSDVDELTAGDSVGQVKETVNMLVRKLKGSAAVALAVIVLPFVAWCDLGPSTIHDNIPGTATLREIVEASGASGDWDAMRQLVGEVGDAATNAMLTADAAQSAADAAQSAADAAQSAADAAQSTADAAQSAADAAQSTADTALLAADAAQSTADAALSDAAIGMVHEGRLDNPHNVTAEQIGAASAEDLAPVADDARNAYLYSRSINLYMTANTNAWFAGTNYVFGADAASRHRFAWEPGMDAATVPCSMALYENRDGSKQRVWDQRDWVSWYWTFKANQMRSEIAATNAQIYAAITNDANNAWAKRYAATGRVNPDASTTYIDTKAVCLSPGMNWETVANVGGCGYWTIVGNGAVIGGSGTNAVLDIKDFEGNSILRIAKGEHRLAWLESSDFVGSMTDADGWVCFDMMASVQPVGYFSTSLDSSDFVAESDAGCPAQHLWENLGNGKWRVHFLLKPGIDSAACFAKFQVEIEGKTQVEYEAGVSIKGGLIYNGVTIAPVIPQNVAVGDTITWKVIAK